MRTKARVAVKVIENTVNFSESLAGNGWADEDHFK